MKKSDLKKMIKPLVRECLTEIFAEMKLESIVEGVVQKAAPSRGPSVRDAMGVKPQPQVVQEQRQAEISEEERKDMLKRRLGIDENEWRAMYEGTQPLDEDDTGKPELVSESTLRQSGLMKDYSKFV